MMIRLVVAALFVTSAVAFDASSNETCWQLIQSYYPRQYVAYRTSSPPKIDGELSDAAWEEVGFSDSFVDISTTTKPWLDTRMKIRFDDEWLYIAGRVQDPNVWANITHTCHCYDPKEDQVIFHDNDFEVFVDADGSCHHYKEFEINAANASWDLCLDVPYENGGYENSTRVFGKHGFDMVPPLFSATRVVDGVLNDPSSHPKGWNVEIAFPLKKLAYNTSASVPPKQGSVWRINFSRVEYHVKIENNRYIKDPSCQSCPDPGAPVCDNWVWSPMHAIDVHHPEMWGILQFSDDTVNSTAVRYYDQWPLRYTAHVLFYALYDYAAKHGGSFTDSLADLRSYAEYPQMLAGDCTSLPSIALSGDEKHYVATVADLDNPSRRITVTDTRLFQAHGF